MHGQTIQVTISVAISWYKNHHIKKMDVMGSTVTGYSFQMKATTGSTNFKLIFQCICLLKNSNANREQNTVFSSHQKGLPHQLLNNDWTTLAQMRCCLAFS